MRVAGRAFEVAFYVAVAAGLLWIAAHFTVTRSGWVRQTVQKLVAQEVANYLGQEISIGRIGGDIWRTVRIEGFSVSGPDGRPDIAVERIELKWDLAAALRKKAPLPATVRRVRLVRPYIRLARDAKGRWNLERLPAAERIEPKKLRPLPITLEIVDGAVDYDIVVREFRGRREVGRLQHISATFVLTHDGVAFLNAKLEADCPYLRSAKVKAAYQLKGKSGAVEVAAEGLVLRAAGALVKRKMPAQLLSGTADAQLSAWIAGPKQQPHWTVRARVSNLAVRPRSVKTTIYAPQLSLAASDNGATISAQRVNWDGGQCNLQASVWDYKKPMISASLTGLTVDPQAAVDAAPPEVEQKLLETFGKHVQCGRVTGQLSLIGPLQHLNLTADLHANGPVSIAAGSGTTALADGADLSLTALDSSAPAIATSVAFDNLRVSDLPPVELGNGTRAVPSFSRVPKAIITASYAGKSLCAHAPLAVDEIRGLPVAVARLKGQAYLAGDVLQLADIRAEAAGGQVTAFAALDVRQNRLAAAAQLDSVDVAQIRPLLGDQFDHTLGGKASGVVWASGEKDKGIADCSFLVAAPQVDRYAAAQAAAAVRVGEAGIEVPWFVVEADQGRVAGRARIENGTLTARVAAADVDVGAVGVLAGAEGLEGRAWAVAEVSGPLDQPAFEVETTVIGPGIGGQRAEALYAKANGTPHQLRVSRLLAAREGTVAEASLTAVNLSSEQPYADLDGTFRILGAELPTVLSWAGLSADELEGGQVAVEGKISGTVLDPAITGTAHVAGVSWDIYRLESLTAPIQLRGATLRIGPAAGTALGVPVSGSARIDNLTDPQSLEASATFATGPIDLSRLVALHRYAVGIEGEARVRHAELFFANGHLRGASASVDCNGVTLGEQRLAPFSFVVETQDEAIYLKPATVEIAGGRCELSGRYEPASGEITAQASMADCNVDELLEAVSSVLPAGVVGEKVAKLLPSLALRMAGRVSGVLAVSGPSSAPDARVQLSAVDLSLDQRSLPRLQLACRYDASDRTISDIAAEAQYADGLITASGSAALGGRIDLLVEATNLDVARLREWLPAGHSLAGTLQFTCQVGGQTESPVVRGSFDVLDVNVEGIRFDIVSVPVFDVAEGSIAFDTLIFKRGEHEIRAHGRLPFTWQGPSVPGDRPVAVSASVSALDLETVFAILDEYRRAKGPEGPARVWSAVEAHGEVDAEAQVSGTLQKPQIGGSLRLTRAALRFPSWAKPVQDIDLVLVMEPVPEGSLITVSRASARYENSTLAVGGSVGLKRVGPSAFLDNNWNLTFTVEANGQKLPGGGTVDAAKVVATFLSTEPGKASFRFAEGFAKLGSGDVKIEGGADITQADLARLQRNSFDIKVAARRVRLVYSPYVDGLVSGAIEIANPEEGADAVVRGQLVLSQAVVAPEFTGLGTMRVVRGAPKLAPAFSLDVGVAVGDNVVFRAAGVQAVVRPAPAAHLSGTPQEPRLSGAVSLLRGQASMPGGLLEIERFDLSYSVAPQPTAYEPPKPLELRARLSGQATRVISEVMVDQRTVGPVRIYLSIDGQVPGELSVRATSEPPLAEEQIYAILGAVPLGGFTPAAGGATEVLSQRFVSLIAMGLRASILEPLEAKLREFLGLTEFTVSFQLEQPVEVRLGKYLARNLLVSYRYQLGTPGRETWLLSVSYEVLPNVVVSYRARDDGEERFSVGIRRDL